MKYIETELVFAPQKSAKSKGNKSFQSDHALNGISNPQTDVLGIRVRIGNQPMVYNLKDLAQKSGKPLPEAVDLQTAKDHYLVIHAISAIRTQGQAMVDELQYFATAADASVLQTIDLVPKTRFNEVLKAGIAFESTLDLSGEISPTSPANLVNTFLSELIDIDANTKLQLSTSANFIGKFIYSLQLPVVQSAGIGSCFCSWILRPDEKQTPLLGDQLLIQSIAVPQGTKSVSYKISGLVKADRGLFWKQQQMQTPEYILNVELSA